MSPSIFYKFGARTLRQRFGLQEDDVSTPALGLGATVASTPFLGLIGEKPLRHDPLRNPNIPRAQSLEELSSHMRPGDVLITTRPGQSFWKTPQIISSGSEFFHTIPVVDIAKGKPRVYVESDALYDYSTKAPYSNYRSKPWEAVEALKKKYPEAILLRPDEPLSEAQLQALQKQLQQRARRRYDIPRSFKNWFRDIFVPKHTPRKAKICKGDICSTLPLQARHQVTGFDLDIGKSPKSVLPADWLRSQRVKPIAAYVDPTIKHLSPRALKALRYGGRGVLGAGLGLGAYALGKKLLPDD